LSTAIGLTPGGSGTVHIYTQTIQRTTYVNNKRITQKKTVQHNNKRTAQITTEQHNNN